VPTDTKQFIAAIALIRRDGTGGRDEWLTLWNAGRGCYQFVEAYKLDDESFRQSLIREVAWETGLRTGKDFLVAGGARARVQFAEVDRCQAEPIWFVVEFYLVELMGHRQRRVLAEHDRVAWLTAEEVQAGTARDGRPLCPRLRSLLKQADILQPWQ
jgi:hypothetical protein